MENLEAQKEASVLELPKFKRFIEQCQIQAEDFAIIEELASFDTNYISLHLHNFFPSNKDGSVEELKRQIEFDEKTIENDKSGMVEQRLAIYKTILPFAEKYGWVACYHLVTILIHRE